MGLRMKTKTNGPASPINYITSIRNSKSTHTSFLLAYLFKEILLILRSIRPLTVRVKVLAS
jgi:hypothetical protein